MKRKKQKPILDFLITTRSTYRKLYKGRKRFGWEVDLWTCGRRRGSSCSKNFMRQTDFRTGCYFHNRAHRHRRSWRLATPELSPVRCWPFGGNGNGVEIRMLEREREKNTTTENGRGKYRPAEPGRLVDHGEFQLAGPARPAGTRRRPSFGVNPEVRSNTFYRFECLRLFSRAGYCGSKA
ncbi:hypothetical protein EVAR_102097_1 [Eumeta japonica]|uniref:Uncharacterized protein n=1 Tax=Eumeta variegata TaxID=151549 RepID=A0A4C1TZS7_EUMVA|nr:hypothetical protein EVAR_102097_1 [Eumeta japonica]